MSRRGGDFVPLLIGGVALAVGTALGWNGRLVEAAVTPPLILRAALVGVSVVVGLALFGAALRRLAGDAGSPEPDWPRMVRGVRLAFLGVAAFAAAAGWVLGSPAPDCCRPRHRRRRRHRDVIPAARRPRPWPLRTLGAAVRYGRAVSHWRNQRWMVGGCASSPL